jgi:hypothetical protein
MVCLGLGESYWAARTLNMLAILSALTQLLFVVSLRRCVDIA